VAHVAHCGACGAWRIVEHVAPGAWRISPKIDFLQEITSFLLTFGSLFQTS
jgi:hypothetical protein